MSWYYQYNKTVNPNILDICVDHWLSLDVKCHYCPGWAATLRLEEITKRWLGARFRDYSCPVHCGHWDTGRCELRDNHLSTESSVHCLASCAGLVTPTLGCIQAHTTNPNPHNPTWNSESSAEEKVLYRFIGFSHVFQIGFFYKSRWLVPNLQIQNWIRNYPRRRQLGLEAVD